MRLTTLAKHAAHGFVIFAVLVVAPAVVLFHEQPNPPNHYDRAVEAALADWYGTVSRTGEYVPPLDP